MIDVNWKKMLFVLPAREHTPRQIKVILDSHPEVKFVSFAGSDIVGNDTDEKIPIQLFQKNIEDILKKRHTNRWFQRVSSCDSRA